MLPDADQWRALARSSPWLWHSLHAEIHLPQPDPAAPAAPLEVWLRKPGDVRVEGRRELAPGSTTYRAAGQHRGRQPQDDEPLWRPDGLVAARAPRHLVEDDHGLYFHNYYWIALLDPVELADGVAPDHPGETTVPVAGVEVSGLAVTERHDRETWWAQVSPTPAYDPRCSCCPLLDAEDLAREEWGDARVDAMQADGRVYARTWLVGLDRQSGICVSVAALDGSDPPAGSGGHSMRILGVDETMPGALFG